MPRDGELEITRTRKTCAETAGYDSDDRSLAVNHDTSPLALDMALSTLRPSQRAGSTMVAAGANLLNTIIGGGILGLPVAFKNIGVAVGLGYMVFFGLMSW